ncbi:hypothetical protein PROPHIGD86-1_15 [Mycobacterium phage prophi86-1]|nr:hypothetical protein PROPHIGD86-1_15 [Mycobacterium phage prophi86-1]
MSALPAPCGIHKVGNTARRGYRSSVQHPVFLLCTRLSVQSALSCLSCIRAYRGVFMSKINNVRTRCAVRVANWILRIFAPEYSKVLADTELRRVGVR